MVFRFIARYRWGAADSRMELDPLSTPVSDVLLMDIHVNPCLSTRHCIFSMRLIQNSDMNKLWRRDIRFNFVIGGDGVVYEGRGWNKRAIIPERFRKETLACLCIGFIGTVQTEGLSELMNSATQELIAYGVRENHIAKGFKLHTLFTNHLNTETIATDRTLST